MNMQNTPASMGPSKRILSPEEKVLRYRETENRLLDKATEERLHDALLQAVLTGTEALERTVLQIVAVCMAAGQTFFVTRFKNQTDIARCIIRCLRPQSEEPILFGFYWAENGMGAEILPTDSSLIWRPLANKPATDAKVLPDDVQARLTDALRDAVRAFPGRPGVKTHEGAYSRIKAVLNETRSACRAHGVRVFVTPYVQSTPTAGLLLACLKKIGHSVDFVLGWDAAGLIEEPKAAPAPSELARKRLTRAEEEARKAELRRNRQDAAPAKGQTATVDASKLRKSR